jgi:hypothetical protein
MPKIIDILTSGAEKSSPVASKNSRFQKGSGCYVCIGCQKKTRSTGNGDNEHCRLCETCYEKAGDENALSDGDMTKEAFDAKWNAPTHNGRPRVLANTNGMRAEPQKDAEARQARKAPPKPKQPVASKPVDAKEVLGTCSQCWSIYETCPGLRSDPQTIRGNCERTGKHGMTNVSGEISDSQWKRLFDEGMRADGAICIGPGTYDLLAEEEGRRKEARKVERAEKSEPAAEKKVAEIKPVENAHGFALTRTDSGKYLFAGFPATSIFRWMGSQGWTWEDAMKAVKALGIPDGEIAEGTARIQVNAGKKGGDCGGRGPIPEISADQATALSKAAGKFVEPPKAPAAPAKKAPPKPKAQKA